MTFFWGFLAGLLTVPAFSFAMMLVHALKWACRDTVDLVRYAEMRPNRSKWNWCWIVPKAFVRNFWATLWNNLRGLKRSG